MNRPRPTVFISHSTGTLPASDPCVQVKVALVTALEADGWRVFLDSRSVQAGARWRAEILHALAMSQAGIILLNAQSSQSDWVKAEALIMCFRKSIYPDYTVLPVVFPGADLDRTFLKTYEPFEFNEIQRQIVSFADVESAETFAHRLARNPYLQQSRLCTIAGAAWIQKVADLFQTVDIARLGEAAGYFEEFDPDQGPGLPFTPGAQATHLRWALANLMHRSEPQRCLEGVHYLLDQLGEEKSRRFGSFLLSKWVDNESAETLVNAAQNPAKARLLALNTSESEVAKRYAERIRIETPTGMITSIFSVSILNGDYPPEVLMGKVEEAICLGLLQYPGNRLLQGKTVERRRAETS